MARVFNFSAGPAALPEEVLKQAADEMLDWHGSGQSVMEMSHRGKEFMSIAAGGRSRSARVDGHSRQLQGAVPAGRRLAPVRDDPDQPAARQGRRRLRAYRRVGQEGDQGRQDVLQRQCRRQRRRQELHLRAGAGRLEADQGCRLRPLHRQRDHRRRRIQLDARDRRRAAGLRHVLEHPVARRSMSPSTA